MELIANLLIEMNDSRFGLVVFKKIGRNRKIALSIIIILTLLGLLVIFGPLNFVNNASSLQWNVEIGDEFTYSATVIEDDTIHFSDVNITVRIVDLPELAYSYDESSFVEILEFLKTNSTFQNNSDISEDSRGWINGLNILISRTILPVGDWDFLDLMYLMLLKIQFIIKHICHQ